MTTPTIITVPVEDLFSAYERGRRQAIAEIEQARAEAFAEGERAGEAKIVRRIETLVNVFSDRDSVRRRGAFMALTAAKAGVADITPQGVRGNHA